MFFVKDLILIIVKQLKFIYLWVSFVKRRIYTQNVDGLKLKAGITCDKIVFAHWKITEAGLVHYIKKNMI